MMPAEPRCDHVAGVVSGLRAWELDVGEWERASGAADADAVMYTVMMNVTPNLLGNSLHLGIYLCKQCRSSNSCVAMVLLSPEALEHPRPRQLEMEQVRMMTTGCKSTLSRKARG